MCLKVRKPKRNLGAVWRAMQNCQTHFCGLVPIEDEMDGAKLATSQCVYVDLCGKKEKKQAIFKEGGFPGGIPHPLG